VKNIPGILEVLLQLKKKGWHISSDHMVRGLGKITTSTGLKGRFQILSNAPKIIADVSHNLEGIIELIDQVNMLEPKQLHIIYGAVKDRNIDEIFNQFPKDAQYYLTSGNNSRLMDLKSLAEIAKKNNLEKREFFNVNLALTFVKSIADIEDVVLITGSTFIISEIAEL
jgi:dihydrofolate synthase/folylpolyglutamate synthase